MIDPEQPELSVRRQCELLKVSRSGLYYEPEPTSPDELALMRGIDELHLKHPFYGSRKLSDVLRKEGREANRKRIQRLMRLMRLMGLEAMVPKPNTTEPHPEHVKYPYLLRGLAISRVNQVWATDITYIPMKARLPSPRAPNGSNHAAARSSTCWIVSRLRTAECRRTSKRFLRVPR